MATNLAKIRDLLKPGARSVFASQETWPEQWKEIFEVHNSDKAEEKDIEMRMLGYGQVRSDGSPIPIDEMRQAYVHVYNHRLVCLQFQITKLALVNNLYKSEFPKSMASLKRALSLAKNVLGASILNGAFDTNTMTMGDGKALCATDHPVDTGVVSNRGANADFSEPALEAAIYGIMQFKDVAGTPCVVKPEKLVVTASNQWLAQRVLGSAFMPGGNNNDINPMYNYLPKGYVVNQFITQRPAQWFILTSAEQGLKHFKRLPVETDVYIDYATSTLMTKAEECYSFGASNFRSTYGNTGGAG